MHGRVRARLRALDVECPVGAHVALGVAGHRLGEVARGRADGAYQRHRAASAAQGLDGRGAFVEVGQPRRQVSRVAAFAGQLAEAARDLAQRLGPAAGRVGHQGHVQALVAEVFGHRDGAVDRGLARGHRHVRGVGDDHGALHQRAAGLGVGELRKLLEHAGQLVAAFAAAEVDDDVGAAALGQGLEQYRLAGAEAAGNGGLAAERHRKQAVEHALAGDQGQRRRQARAHRPRHAHRPLVRHRQLDALAGGIAQGAHRRSFRIRARRGHGHHLALGVGRRDAALGAGH